jgi:hypothetical protein
MTIAPSAIRVFTIEPPATGAKKNGGHMARRRVYRKEPVKAFRSRS